jgi:hypothetical protein
MPVNIIENFHLGTDLPLDSRYVVNNKYDVSLYWYPGMQVFQTDSLTKEWFDGSVWHNDASVGDLFVKKTGDMMLGKLSFSPSVLNSGGNIFSPSEGLLVLNSSLGILLDAPYFSLPDASDNIGAYLKIGENGIVQFSSIGNEPKTWVDILQDTSLINNTNENEILNLIIDEDVSFGSASYEISVELPWWRTVQCRIYLDSSLYSEESFTGDVSAIFANSVPINKTGISAGQNIKVTIQSDVDNYSVLADSFFKVEKFGTGNFISPLENKGDLLVYSTEDTRLPVGSPGQLLIPDPSSEFGLNWIDPSSGYGYFAYWAEESSSPTANSYEWSWGNGDEATRYSGVMVPIDCELYGIGTTASGSSEFRVEVMKLGQSVNAISDFMDSSKQKLTILDNPVVFNAGDTVDFRTVDVSVSDSAGVRVAAYFRYKINGLRGPKGDPGDCDDCSIGSSDDVIEGSANLYFTNQRVDDFLIAENVLRESSIGDGFIWDNGELDVSVVGSTGLYAYSKCSSTGILESNYNINVTRTATGRYQYSFTNSLTNNHYGIVGQPFNTSTDTNIQIYNVTNSGFILEVGKGDNGTAADVLVDSDHTVLVLGPPTEMGLGVSREYIDGSLAYRDASIQWLYDNRFDPSGYATENYVNDIISVIDASIVNINSYQITQDNSISAIDSSLQLVNSYLNSIDASIVNINSYQITQDNSISAIDSSLSDYVRKEGDVMSGDLTGTNLHNSGFVTPGSQNTFPNSPDAGSIYFRPDLNQLFTFDSSRNKWLSLDRFSYQAGKNRVKSSNIGYLEVGSASQSSNTGFRMPKNGTIIGASIENRLTISNDRTMSIRVNDVSAESLIIQGGESGSNRYNLNSDFNEGDTIQLVIEAGGDTIKDIIAAVNVAWK